MNCCKLWTALILLLAVTVVTTISEENNFEMQKYARNASESQLITDFVDYIFNYRDNTQARTFGHKRIQFMLMPMMYKMGIMSTLLIVLTVISLKGLMIGVTLLMLKLSSLFGHFYASVSAHHHHQGWSPIHGQPVHLYVHGNHHGSYGGGPWEPPTGPEEDHYYYKG